MRSTSMIAALALGLALTACGKKTETTTTTETNATAEAGNLAATPAAALPAQQFTDTIAGAGMFEIQSGKLAETNGGTPAIKDIGKMLVTDHTKAGAMLKKAAAKTSPVVAIPMLLPADLKAKLDALKPLKGADFDKLFVEQQVEGHQQALDVLNAYSAGGDQPSLKEFAASAIPVVQGHLTKLQAQPK